MESDQKETVLKPQGENTVEQTAEQQPVSVDVLGTAQQKGGAVLIVWQWLSYALWSVTLVALSVLLGITLAHFILDQNESSDATVYVVAILVCLLPTAVLADRFYSKKEPENKHGFQAVIMVIHAVLAFIAMLGSFIAVVVTTLSIIIDLGSTDEKLVVIGTSLAVGLLGLLFFIRIINPVRLARVARLFPWIVVGITVVTLIAAAAGPLVAGFRSRTDRVIENNLSNLDGEIQNYTRENDKLPESLEQLSFEDYNKDAKILVDKNLVRYRILEGKDNKDECRNNIKPAPMPLGGKPSSAAPALPYNNDCFYSSGQSTQFRYELCVTWQNEKNSRYNVTPAMDSAELNYVSTYSHPKGEQCFKPVVFDYNYSE